MKQFFVAFEKYFLEAQSYEQLQGGNSTKWFTVLLAIIMCVVLTGCQAVIVREKIEVSKNLT